MKVTIVFEDVGENNMTLDVVSEPNGSQDAEFEDSNATMLSAYVLHQATELVAEAGGTTRKMVLQ